MTDLQKLSNTELADLVENSQAEDIWFEPGEWGESPEEADSYANKIETHQSATLEAVRRLREIG